MAPLDSNRTPISARSTATADGVGPPSMRSVDGSRTTTGAAPSEAPAPSGILRKLEKGFIYLDRLIARFVPGALNPMLHTGALAVATLFVATASGVLLLFWYKPSVHLAYESVEAMSNSPFGAGLMRSLHRYSSDAAVFFGAIHALRIFFEQRFDGSRWLAWVTGALMMALLWFIGWTGYWLVWDLRAQGVAVGTAKLLDVLPVFTDPLGRSFVTDDSVNSLLFFVVFFIHMLIPLVMGIAMWLHITRLARARYLTSKAMTLWVTGLLLLICFAYPATSEAPAQMTAIIDGFTMDWWFLFPLPIIDRLGAGVLWSLFVVGNLAVFTIPWWLAGKRKQAATVIDSRCNECKQCYVDCPYEAIEMVPRTDGNERYPTQASVIDSKCVSCGICAGSCDTMGIGLDWFSTIEQRRRIGAWLNHARGESETVHIAFVCAESAGTGFTIDPESGICAELPGYRVLRVPCAGWVQPLMVERAIRQGAGGVMIVSCPPDRCAYREGAEWERLRIEGVREPVLRADKVGAGQVQFVALDRTRKSDLIRAAARFRGGEEPVRNISRPRVLIAAGVTLLLAVFAGILGVVSDAPYTAPSFDGSEFVISLKHPGLASENCRTLTEEELASKPVHMRRERVCERTRPSVRVRVAIDGTRVFETSVVPSGIWEDGNSVTVERIRIEPGEHTVRVAIGETADPEEWTFGEERTMTFTDEARRVVVFDRLAGFTWY
jgi:coenzyme F420-reducing hydrogenase delta subunit/Pyruvate/2-oxoacid:ferredoxin oxidoreductase delta subunit